MNGPELDPPRRIDEAELATRYGIKPRLAAEWIAKMKAAGVIAKIGRIRMARLSACDAWVAAGGKVESGRRR